MSNKKKHRWRPCPLGYHWRKASQVDAHLRNGHVVRAHPRSATCVKNKSKKDQIYQDELEYIAEKYFKNVKEKPTNDNLDFDNGNEYDHIIAGWTKYWNEIFQPQELLDPNLVKALIATESGFKISALANAGKREGRARGLMQITALTIRILKDEKGELRDHLVNVNQNDMTNATLNIASGIRWLFRKKETASAKLKKEASWIWAVADYKGYFREYSNNPNHKHMNNLINLYNRLNRGNF